MKLRILGVLFSLLSVTILACEEKAPPAEEPQPAQPGAQPAAAPAAGGDAGAVCAGMVDAAKAKDMDKIIAVSTPGAAEALAPEGLKEGVMGALTGGACGEVKVSAEDANKATVQIKGAAGAKDLPFIKGADGWRFDVATYLAKNPAGDDNAKGKKATKKGDKADKKKGGKKGKKGKK